MTSTRPAVVELLADCLRHPDTELTSDQIADWRHESGVLMTDTEADTIRKATLGETRAAVDVCKAESEASLAFFRGWLGED